MDEETTAGDIDVETPMASIRPNQASPSVIVPRRIPLPHELFSELEESDADAEDSFE